MLTIRLTRKGKKNQPFFRVVLVDKRRSSKGGRAVEELGYVDPLKKRKSFNKERILYWISKGAKPSPTIHNYLVSEKIIDAKKINLFKKSKKPVDLPAQAGATATAKPVTPAAASAQGSGDPKPAQEKELPAAEVKPEVEAPKEVPPAA